MYDRVEYFCSSRFDKCHFYDCTLAPMQCLSRDHVSSPCRWHERNFTFQYRSVSRRGVLSRYLSGSASREVPGGITIRPTQIAFRKFRIRKASTSRESLSLMLAPVRSCYRLSEDEIFSAYSLPLSLSFIRRYDRVQWLSM